MKLTHCLIPLLLLAACLKLQATPGDVLPVAVFDFESKDEAVRDLGPKVAAIINASLSAEPKLLTVERAELEKILGEQELGLSGTVQPGSAAKVGQLTGAKILVTGRVFKADKELFIISKILSTETSRVYAEMVKGPIGGSLPDLATELSKKIVASLDKNLETLAPKVESNEERRARITKAAAGKSHPTVSLKIAERHFGRPVIDPAAETELGVILQSCGFTLLSQDSMTRPEIEITGEAFSAFGVQKGNLVSCKARVELKAQKQNGEILAVDRQSGVAVDIAEQTAAKTALQEATGVLAERFIPKLSH